MTPPPPLPTNSKNMPRPPVRPSSSGSRQLQRPSNAQPSSVASMQRNHPVRALNSRPNQIRPPPVPRSGQVPPGQSSGIRPRLPVQSNSTVKPFYRGPPGTNHSVRPNFRPVRPPFRSRMNGPVNGQPPQRPNGQPTNNQSNQAPNEGRTVIGTKTVGGQQHEITMKDTALRPGGIRPPAVSTNQQKQTSRPNTSTPPANISVSTKMVGGKEVQLVTPNQVRRPAVSRPGTNLRMINRNPPNPANQNQSMIRAQRPNLVNQTSQQQTSKPSQMTVKLRRQVITDKPLNNQQSNQPQTKSLIKLSTNKFESSKQHNGDLTGEPQQSKENQDESTMDGVSELQLAKTLLNTGTSKPKLNKATEKLYEKSKVPKQSNNKIEKPSRGKLLTVTCRTRTILTALGD